MKITTNKTNNNNTKKKKEKKNRKKEKERETTQVTQTDLSLCKCCLYFILFGHIVTKGYSFESAIVLLKQDIRKRWDEEFSSSIVYS